MKDIELLLLALLLAHDAFWIMDMIGERGLDRLAAYWRRGANALGWSRWSEVS